MIQMIPEEKIFSLRKEPEFSRIALDIYRNQSANNVIYRQFLESLRIDPGQISDYRRISFLPVGFFRTHKVISGNVREEKTFLSSGTSGMERSRHFVRDLNLYRASLTAGFRFFFGDFEQYDIFALTPAPGDHPGSSLVFMVNEWIRMSGSDRSGFYMEDQERLANLLSGERKRKTLLIGITWALLDFAEHYPVRVKDGIIMETGGMKGRRREMIREELHEELKKKFNAGRIYSEYGMTELLSQAYSEGNGIFRTPPWMKVLIRDPDGILDVFPHLFHGLTQVQEILQRLVNSRVDILLIGIQDDIRN